MEIISPGGKSQKRLEYEKNDKIFSICHGFVNKKKGSH
jgi:hypothetical protein